MKLIAETPRLFIHEFSDSDAPFIIELLNTKGWLDFIGNRNIRTAEDALKYLNSSIYSGYSENGFGLWKVTDKITNCPAGMCGLLKRKDLEHADIGFALMPEFIGKGYGQEASTAVLKLASEKFNIDEVWAITDPANTKSINLLLKSGFGFKHTIRMHSGNELLLLFSNKISSTDERTIHLISSRFFAAFGNRNGKGPHLNLLNDFCSDKTTIVKANNGNNEVADLNDFITPRQKILTNGSLIDFEETETNADTTIHGNIASRISYYHKSGVLNGEKFAADGIKIFSFCKLNNSWKIASVVWQDLD